MFKDIPGYEDRYSATEDGIIWSLLRDRQLNPSLDSKGYQQVSLYWHGKKYFLVHHLIAITFIGPKLKGLEVRHLDGNCLNNHVDNLVYGTHSENMYDRVRHGRHLTRWGR